MRKLLFAILLFSSVAYAWSVPARRITQIYTLQDGSQQELTLTGDEFGHCFLSADGRAFLMDEEGIMQPVSADEVRSRRQTRSLQRNSTRRVRQNITFQGTKRGLVILVNFSDKEFVTRSPQLTLSRIFNEHGYSEGYFTGSVHDYFYDQSYGLFDLEFDVVGPYTLSHNMAYYGENNPNGDDKRAATMVAEACRLADKDVDFARYDWDSDNEVDQVYVIYAGYSEASGAPPSTIWPHEWDLESATSIRDGEGAIRLDGTVINTYACSNELQGIRGSRISGIGTACHEFSHCLGLPDMYDTTGKAFGMDCWDLLDYGCYNNDEYTPAPFTSYERMFCGWLTPIVLTGPATVEGLAPITLAPVAFIIYNKANPNEFYMLENHQKQGWDSYSYGHGLLVIHVDYDEDAWYDNSVNDVASHQRMTIIPADNSLSGRNLAGDPFPGTSNNTSLTNSTQPAATLYNMNSDGQKLLSCPITNIQETATGLISFETAGDQTDISDIKREQDTSVFYDFLGRILPSRPMSGFYLQGGKKYMNK